MGGGGLRGTRAKHRTPVSTLDPFLTFLFKLGLKLSCYRSILKKKIC